MPPALASHFSQAVFEKSQTYGRDKAKYALFSGIYKQAIDSLLLHYGFYAWAWAAGGDVIRKLGYGEEYEACQTEVVRGTIC